MFIDHGLAERANQHLCQIGFTSIEHSQPPLQLPQDYATQMRLTTDCLKARLTPRDDTKVDRKLWVMLTYCADSDARVVHSAVPK
jgi:hypothetical protein